MNGKNITITVNDIEISVSSFDKEDFICITDIANAKSNLSRPADIIKNWMRNRNTLEFLGTWETIYNPDFKVVEFDHFRSMAGSIFAVAAVREPLRFSKNKQNAIRI
ncbi:KilA domain-containing protein [Methanimicrococcus blatticola]|uniref:KilA domain-containing protein n=1 Tax=Methanimicrococcus blatticola TaxID=91560 RepID=A0A484F5E9_9EURY|nr:KilA domain-containing protein [Methanimicrococcus blatticola]